MRKWADAVELAGELAARADQDIERGFTTHGPHRDELMLSLGDRDLRAYGSQGQQRVSLLALLLAEREAIALAIAVAAKIEEQNAETLGDEEVGDVFEPTLVFRAIRVPAVDQDGGAVPANGEEPAAQGEAVARPKGDVLVRRRGHLWCSPDRMTLGVGEAVGDDIGNGEVADHACEKGDREKPAFH